MNDLPTSRSDAKREKSKLYFNGIQCKRGHVSPRRTDSGCCVECSKLSRAKHYANNSESIILKNSLKYHQSVKAKIDKSNYNKEYRQKNKDYYTNYNKNYYKDPNKAELVREIRKRSSKNVRSTVNGKLRHSVSNSISKYLKTFARGKCKEGSFINFVDWTMDELVSHLESQFKDGMSWDNYGFRGWHIDHIKPHSMFPYSSMDDPLFKECWSLTNLQPLWWLDNVKKSNKHE